jgi:hypothetical protein
MKLALTLFITLLAFTVQSQENLDKLLGKWSFEDIHEKGKLDPSAVKMVEMFFGSMTFQFNTDGLYQALIIGMEDQGKWSLEGNNIALASNRGNTVKLEIIKLEGSELVVKMERGSFIMKKLEVTELTVLGETSLPYEAVAATKQQASKKWMLVRKESLNDASEIVKETMSELLKGSFLQLNENGEYEAAIFNLKESGEWRFGEENKSIITKGESGENTWNIIQISDTELILIKGTMKERWVFEALAGN